MAEQIKVFISYSRQDKSQIDQLYQALSGDDELEVFLDEHDIAAAENWKERLESLIRAADTVIFATSPASAASDICRWEVEQAAALNKRILPVILKDVPDGTAPAEIARLNYIFLRDDAEFKPALITIGEALKVHIDWVREHTRLAELAHRWDLATQLGAQPLRGKELEGAESWLASQPKDAPPPTEQQRSYIYQSRKAATRRQRITVAGSLAALLVVGVLGIFAWGQRNAAVEGREQAETALRTAIKAADDIVLGLASDFTEQDVPQPVIKNLLERAEILHGDLSDQFGDDPELMRSRGTTLNIMANTYAGVGDLDRAFTLAKEALNLRNRVIDMGQATPRLIYGKSATLSTLAGLSRTAGNDVAAQEYRDAGLKLSRELVVQEPDNLLYAAGLANSLNNVATSAITKGDLQKAAETLVEGLRILRRFDQEDIESSQFPSDFRATLVVLLRNQARALRSLGDVKQAQEHALEAAQVSAVLFEKYPNNSAYRDSFIVALANVADYVPEDNTREELEPIAKASEALQPQARRVAQLQMRFVLASPEDIEARENLLYTYRILFQGALPSRPERVKLDIRKKENQLTETDKANLARYGEKSAALWQEIETILGAPQDQSIQDPDYLFAYLRTYGMFGDQMAETLNFDKAQNVFSKVLASLKKLIATSPGNLVWQDKQTSARYNLVKLNIALEEYPQAVALLKENIAYFQSRITDTPQNRDAYISLHDTQVTLAETYEKQNKLGDGQRAYRAALDTLKAGDAAISNFYQGHYFLLGSATRQLSKRLVKSGYIAEAVLLEENSADTLMRKLPHAAENEVPLRRALGALQLNAASKRLRMQEYDRAKALYIAANETIIALFEEDPADFLLAAQQIAILDGLFQATIDLQDFEGLLPIMLETQRYWQTVAAVSPLSPDELISQEGTNYSLGFFNQSMLNKPDAARQRFLENIESGEALLLEYPEDYRFHYNLLQNFKNLIEVDFAQDDIGVAADHAVRFKSVADTAAMRFPDVSKLQDLKATADDFFVQTHGHHAYNLLFEGDFAQAEQRSRAAIAVAPDALWLYTNLGHALMFQEKREAALDVYNGKRGQEFTDGALWEDVLLDDFAKLREKGRTHPLMDEIEAHFQNPDNAD